MFPLKQKTRVSFIAIGTVLLGLIVMSLSTGDQAARAMFARYNYDKVAQSIDSMTGVFAEISEEAAGIELGERDLLDSYSHLYAEYEELDKKRQHALDQNQVGQLDARMFEIVREIQRAREKRLKVTAAQMLALEEKKLRYSQELNRLITKAVKKLGETKKFEVIVEENEIGESRIGLPYGTQRFYSEIDVSSDIAELINFGIIE